MRRKYIAGEREKKLYTAKHGFVHLCRTCFTHCTAEVVCVTVCVCVTRQMFFFSLFICGFFVFLSSA